MHVLLVGESWNKLVYHQKGFDHFVTTHYEEGATHFVSTMEEAGIDVSWMRAHDVPASFPSEASGLSRYDAIVLSDIGSNSFLLSPETFEQSVPTVDRLALVRDYVRGGGGLVMVGGYMSFTGIDAKARFGSTALSEAMPVAMGAIDDRVELPAGSAPRVVGEHPIVAGLPSEWPILLGYNRFEATQDAHVVATINGDPLLVASQLEEGRSVAFASDLAPHWAPPEFVEWDGYAPLWSQLIRWAAGADRG